MFVQTTDFALRLIRGQCRDRTSSRQDRANKNAPNNNKTQRNFSNTRARTEKGARCPYPIDGLPQHTRTQLFHALVARHVLHAMFEVRRFQLSSFQVSRIPGRVCFGWTVRVRFGYGSGTVRFGWGRFGYGWRFCVGRFGSGGGSVLAGSVRVTVRPNL